MHLTAEHFGGEKLNGCNDYLVISYPAGCRDKSTARSSMVGVDVIETDTFRANRLTMAEYGLQDRMIEINQAGGALRAARSRTMNIAARNQGHARVSWPVPSDPTGKLPSANDPELSNAEL